MKYSEITDYPRSWNRATHPVVAHVVIDKRHLQKFESVIEDQARTRVLGHDLIDSDQVVVHVGCPSDDVRRAVEAMWD